MPALPAAVLALLTACSGGAGADVDATEVPAPPADFAATAEVDRVLQVVAGTGGAAWILTEEDGAAAVHRFDPTEELTEVTRPTGQGHQIAAHGDGVVVTRRAGAAEECEETAVEALVVDAAGGTVAEAGPAPVWSASSGWVEKGPYRRYPTWPRPPSPRRGDRRASCSSSRAPAWSVAGAPDPTGR
ncbi:hypothetical protein [Blastococcus sp. SYSU D01042]